MERTYDNVIGLRAVTSLDGMTASWARIPPDLLEKISVRIINEVKGVNRVVYDISTKPPQYHRVGVSILNQILDFLKMQNSPRTEINSHPS